MERRCCICKCVKDIELFGVQKDKRSGHSYLCNECKAKKNREAYKINPKVFYNSSVKWMKNNPQKRRAHEAVALAVRTGKIIKPSNCENCGSSGRLDGHHHKGYEEEYMLDVQWLCRKCHHKTMI